MGNLFNKLKTDRIEALKSKDTIKKDLLGTLIGEASKETKEPEDAKIIATIKKFINNNVITLGEHSKVMTLGDIEDTIKRQKLQDEIAILESYLPKQLSEDAIRAAITQAKNLGNDNIGSIMKYFKENFEGRYDGALVSKIIKES